MASIRFTSADQCNSELVREIVLTRLRDDPSWNSLDDLFPGLEKYVTLESPTLVAPLAQLAREIFYRLMFQCIITPGCEPPATAIIGGPRPYFYLPFFRVTTYGREVLLAGRTIPHDPEHYIESVCRRGPVVLDATGHEYLEEALSCFNAGCHLGSVLLLGVAGESVLLRLYSVALENLTIPGASTKGVGPRAPVSEKHKWLVRRIESKAPADRSMLPESLKSSLVYLYDLIRRQRNELGHPQATPPDITREVAFMYFRLFPSMVSDAEAFAQYCMKSGI